MKRYAILFGILLAVATVAASARAQNIPEPSGSFALTGQGSFAVCLNPAANYAEESCSASNALVYPVTDVGVGVPAASV